MADVSKNVTCGIVMPISEIDGCDEAHWAEVLEIITDSIESSGFAGDLVSNADDVGIIHKRIIQNLYDNPIVVCDVSGKNPNVMFELGLRLAFDKPTIIVKDDKTAYSFDTSAIEHLEYPRDLRFSKIVDFKKKLSAKLKATFEKSNSDPEYTTFLKHFGQFKVAKLEKKEVSGQEYIIDELKGLRKSIARLENFRNTSRYRDKYTFKDAIHESDYDICLSDASKIKVSELKSELKSRPDVHRIIIEDRGDHEHVLFDVLPSANIEEISEIVQKYEQHANLSKHRSVRYKNSLKS